MTLHRFFRTLLILLILGLNIGCDQISKSIARQELSYYEQIAIIDDYVILTKVENKGAFLSLGHALPDPIKTLLLIVLPAAILALAFGYLLVKWNLPMARMVGICFVVGGGMGNIYDRIIYGSVTDFLHIDFVVFQTGIFNMADVSVMVGAFIILIDVYISRKRLSGTAVEQTGEEKA